MTTNSARTSYARKRSRSATKTSGWTWRTKAGIIAVILLIVTGLSWAAWTSNRAAGKFPFQVGTPRPGAMAPPIRLSTARGGSFDLAALHGKTVLLYFQEGIMCEPCWDQNRDIEANFDKFRALGIDTMATVTADPADLLNQKVRQERLTMPVLSDPTLAVSKAYNANLYGMMGTSKDGHSFIVVGPDGRIRWRADYGGAPQYTMYVPVANLLADIGQGLEQASK